MRIAAGRRLVGDARALPIELDDVAVLGEQHLQLAVGPRHDAFRDARMLRQLPVLAVNRHEVARADQRDHQLQLLRGPVARHVDVLHVRRDDVGAAPRDVAHRPGNRLLVARNRPRREHDDVVGRELDEAVVVDGNARQRRLRLALRAGGDAQHVLRGVVRHVGVADLEARRHAQVAEALGDFGVADDAAADERHLAVELRRQVDQHLHPVDARREGRDHELAVRAGEHFLEPLDDLDLGPGESLAIDVGAVRKERQHALRAELGEAVQVEVLAVERRLVDLEVAGMDDDADRRRDGERHAVGHAVRDADELDRERPDGDRLPRRRPVLSRSPGSMPCSSSFGSTSASVIAVP